MNQERFSLPRILTRIDNTYFKGSRRDFDYVKPFIQFFFTTFEEMHIGFCNGSHALPAVMPDRRNSVLFRATGTINGATAIARKR